jgi:hypothetical protein
MVNKSKINGTSRQLLIVSLLAPVLALAQQCVLQTRTVTQGQIQIEERSQVSAQIVPVPGGDQRCMISMRGRVGATWYTGFGEFVFPRTGSPEQACVSARSRAEASITSQAGSRQVATDSTLVCREDPTLDALRRTDVGTVAKLAQYRPHPDYPNDFRHNGTRCRWFLDPAWTGRELRTGQGIICQLQDDNYVVVDKF